ncbi:DUF3465 domain-containing protein [Congregibacter sp.]|uniref:DUF3465 domain-containing protein n=1 Tax=Congregibacter sp. TaxID=2744308 RepID=UPI003F6BFC4B
MKSTLKKKSLPVVIGLALLTWLWNKYGTGALPTMPQTSLANSDRVLEAAFENRQSDLQVQGSGTVIHVLPDDTKGSQHQRFLLELDTGLTLLVAHNIDLAPRIPKLQKGDRIGFNGEYEWTEKGGVMHWTHHDPRGRHEDGWLERGGKRFE